MAPKKPSHPLEDPPPATPSQYHDEEEDDEEEEDEGGEEVVGEEEDDDEEEEEEEQQLEDAQVPESEEEEEEEETGLTQTTRKISKLSQTSQNQPREESSKEEEEGSETDDDITQNSPTDPSFIIKPAVNKKNNSITKPTGSSLSTTKHAVSKNNASMEPTKSTTKRALIYAEGKKDSSKKAKVAKDHNENDKDETTKSPRPAGGRVFSSADEIAILGGMIDYQEQKGVNPHADMGGFLVFVKGRFGFEVITKTQLYEKVRRLKKRFFANLLKGESFIPTKPHDGECFELSKMIWGDNNVVGGVGNIGIYPNVRVVGNGVDHTENVKMVDGARETKKSAKGKSAKGKPKEKGVRKYKECDNNNMKDNGPNIVEKEAEHVADDDVMKHKEDFVKDDEKVAGDDDHDIEDNEHNILLKYPNLFASLSHDMPEYRRKVMMEGICLVDSENARELDNCWKELRMKETELYCRKMELMAEQSRLVVDALKKKM